MIKIGIPIGARRECYALQVCLLPEKITGAVTTAAVSWCLGFYVCPGRCFLDEVYWVCIRAPNTDYSVEYRHLAGCCEWWCSLGGEEWACWKAVVKGGSTVAGTLW